MTTSPTPSGAPANGVNGLPIPPRDWMALGFYVLTVVMDLGMIALGFTVAVQTREFLSAQGLTRGPQSGFELTHFNLVLLYFWVGLISAFHFVDVYRERRFLTGNREIGRIAKAAAVFMVFNGFLAFLLPTRILFSRTTLTMSFILCLVLILLGRWVVTVLRGWLRQRGYDISVALVVGTNEVARLLAAELTDTYHHGYRLVGFVAAGARPGRLDGFHHFGGLNRLERVIRRLRVDEVFICEPDWEAHRVVALFSRLRPLGVRIRLVSDLYQTVVGRVGMPVDAIGQTSILDFASTRLHPLRHPCKRAVDVFLAAFLLLVLSPFFLFVAAAIVVDSGRPVFYRHVRVGQGGRHFVCYKFRTMVRDADELHGELTDLNEAEGPMFKIRYDPRVTRVGRLLRRYSLDEAPQFYNVLRGDMSLVGPRPPLPREVEIYEPWMHKRLLQPMGLTGLWQVSGRNELNFQEMALLDIYYNRNVSFSLDLRIMIKTIFVVLLGQGQ